MERKEIGLHDSFEEMMIKMSEGNSGALNVMMQMVKESDVDAVIHIILLDDMNIRGTQIWIGYKYYCNSDIREFMICIKDKDQGMIDKINEMGKKGNHEWEAVLHSASVKGRELLN